MNTDRDPRSPATPGPGERASNDRPFYGKPFMWLLFALALLLLPVIGYMAQADLSWSAAHPAANALLNGAGMVFLVAGFIGIRRKNIVFHKSCMIAAFLCSVAFLVSYLTRYYLTGSHHYPGHGADKIVYLIILFSHMILAAVIWPMVLRTLYLAWRKRFADHRKIARWTWPVWIYVSITGVIVYLMLYPVAGALYGHE